MLRRRTSLLLLSSVLLAGCGGSSSPPESAAVAAAQRLSGSWRLLRFQPHLSMEEPLRGLLEAQLKTLTINFTGGEFTATGPSVNTSGRYEIHGAQGDTLSGRVYDRAGAGYAISAQFVGSELRFRSEDSPWAGIGALERAP